MNLGLAGRVALVTGSSSGIGRSTVEMLSQEGAQVGITYRHSEHTATELAESIRGRGGEAMTVRYDLESSDSIRNVVQQVASRWGRLDILVNNAVEFGPRPVAQAPFIEHWPTEEWQFLLRTNLEGVFLTTQCAVPYMRRQQWGRIVNVSSTVAEEGLTGSGWYAMAKASVNGLTKSLCRELGPFGILINSVMPAPTDTPRASGIPSVVRKHLAQRSAVGRLLVPFEIARIIAFLCSDANTAITGETIRIGGS